MDEEQVKKIFDDKIAEYAEKNKYGISNVPAHVHNGVDVAHVSMINIDDIPVTTKGDIFTFGTTIDKLSVGSDGQAVIADSTQALGIKWGLPSSNIANFFGDSSDGNITISVDTTLTRDMFYANLTINNGVTLTIGGYRIFYSGTLTNNGTIDYSGKTGGAGTQGTDIFADGFGAGGGGGSATAGLNSGTLGTNIGGVAGTAGTAGGSGGASVSGNSGTAELFGIGVSSGQSGGSGGQGAGGSSYPVGAVGSGGATTRVTQLSSFAIAINPYILGNGIGICGGGGSGSGGTGANSGTTPSAFGGGGGSGGAGTNGGKILLIGKTFVNNGTIKANGGTGGAGGRGGNASGGSGGRNYGGGGGGGGAGGCGGWIFIVTTSYTNTGTIQVNPGSGGAGGVGGVAGAGNGNPGSNGGAGANGKVSTIIVV